MERRWSDELAGMVTVFSSLWFIVQIDRWINWQLYYCYNRTFSTDWFYSAISHMELFWIFPQRGFMEGCFPKSLFSFLLFGLRVWWRLATSLYLPLYLVQHNQSLFTTQYSPIPILLIKQTKVFLLCLGLDYVTTYNWQVSIEIRKHH